MESTNKMREIKLEKVTLNCGTGTDPARNERAYKLLQIISGKKPARTTASDRIPAWGVRPGLKIGCKVTIRGKEAAELLKRLLETIGNKLRKKQISNGYFAFGIKEYIEIPGMVYNRDIGIMGLEVCVTLTRAGLKIAQKKRKAGRVPKRHRITKDETIDFIKKNFHTEIIGEK